ncbi:hypothetical protein Mal15_29780 [Stieleria maiorica]|uniref:Uncharacterized protein n=2 Tax=Stieleria maiorica TaxID=2795974 RepID=A0A5B9MFX3_9BACT|nr:hypothetical protein Mal15_29780 [Stieleria maiorica]
MTSHNRRNWARVTALILLLTVGGVDARGHETQPGWPTSKQLEQVQPPLDHAIPMARQLVTQLRHRFDATQLTLLDEVNHQLQMMQRVDAGHLGADRQPTALAKSRLVNFFRWKAESALLELLGNLSGDSIVDLDFRSGAPSHLPDTPIAVGPQDNMILLRVRAQPADGRSQPVQLSMGSWDLASERPTEHFPVDIARHGTTYVLLDLKRVPTDRTTSHLTLRDVQTQDVLYTYALTFQSAPLGQLALDVVDEDGKSIPVLMSIASHETGNLREPAEAVDLRSVLNEIVPHLSPSGRGYMFYLPGQKRGRYWVVRPPLEMPLPAGDWDIKVLRGLEFTPVQQTVSVRAGQWTRVKLQPKRWTNMPSRGWYSGDDHVHAQLLTSADARKLLDYTRAVDINVANILEMGDVMRTYYPQRGFGDAFRVQHGNHWLIPGQEDPRSVLGHAIGLNLKSKVRDLDRYLSNDWIAAQIQDQGGLYGHTHVGPNACFVHREMALFTPDGIVDFNSIMQSELGTELYYDFLNMGFKMTASAGADTPYGGTIGAVRTYAFTGSPESFSPDQWFAALKRGRTFVTNGPMIEFQVDDAMPGDQIEVDDNRSLSVRVKAWGDIDASAPKQLRLIKLGQAVEVAQSEDERGTELEIATSIDSDWGFWIAAHAVGRDGSQAHTTPIYVTRKGFRHWDPDSAKALINRQLEVLREIRREVQTAEQRVASGSSSLDYWSRRTADQADDVRAKVSQAERTYQQLLQTLAEESAIRAQAGE